MQPLQLLLVGDSLQAGRCGTKCVQQVVGGKFAQEVMGWVTAYLYIQVSGAAGVTHGD